MASTRELWVDRFFADEIPAFPCPRCDRGNLRLIKSSFEFADAEYSRKDCDDGHITPIEVTRRFILLLKCAVAQCGEIVSVHGDVEQCPRESAEFGECYENTLIPRGMNPGPPLATIPQGTPKKVACELRTAFQLFWVDAGACANRLRISVERILDESKIPPGTLYQRIKEFQEQKCDTAHAETFDALRHVGNVGSHEGSVRREILLDAFEIYQDALAELFGNRKVHIANLRQKIIESKGK